MVGDKVESIHFDDSSVWDLTGGLHIENIGTNTGLYGTDYADVIDGNTNSESLYGFSGNDTITSGGGYDYLYGGVGNDTLVSTDGNSHMYGGDGADTFVIQSMNGSDYVHDFSTTDGDVIDIHSVLSGYDPVNDTLSDFVQINEVSGNSFLSVDQDEAGTTYSMTQIAVISGVTGVTNVDDLVTNGHLLLAA